ncbi:hypothetical protein KSS87_007701 [Heliosperma pusillum]|nr:hypothetical protein KSS87_007701 [Heliosperma pusillum]
MEGIVVIFDFDKTIIDVDSDNWVVDELGFTELFDKLLPTMPWNTLMSHVIKRILSEAEKKKVIYLGDGKGDYCPTLKLRDGDHMMPRKNFPVWDLISENPSLIRAQIHEWTDGAELEQVLLSTIQDIFCKGDGSTTMAQFLNIDCKLETMPKSTHEAFPKALRVPF